MALLRKEKTIIILVKDVSNIRMAGARVRIVSRKIICNVMATSSGPSAAPIVKLKEGIGILSAAKAKPEHTATNTIVKINVFLMSPPYSLSAMKIF